MSEAIQRQENARPRASTRCFPQSGWDGKLRGGAWVGARPVQPKGNNGMINRVGSCSPRGCKTGGRHVAAAEELR